MKDLSTLKVLIVGLGQIGGSIAIDLVERNLVAEVAGYDTVRSVIDQAFERNIITRKVESLKNEIGQADLIILAAPIRQIIKLVPLVIENLSESSAILDTAGTKNEVFAAVDRCKTIVNYFGGHPLAGNEHCGIDAAEGHKFEGKVFVVTPYADPPDDDWLNAIQKLLSGIGCKPVNMSAEEHDRIIALTSHLPYAVALTLMQLYTECDQTGDNLQHLIGGSFRSATRVAASSPELTLDMFLTNGGNIATMIDAMISQLLNLKTMIESGDITKLQTLIEGACESHRNMRK
jgi:prephenate dehydrogenase